MNALATDITVIDPLHLEAWQNSLNWPITDVDYFAINSLVLSTIKRLVYILPPIECALVLSDVFPFYINQIIHARIVRQRCQEQSIPLRIGKLSQQFYEPDWALLSTQYKRVIHGNFLNAWLRKRLKDIKFNGSLPLHKRIHGLFSPDATGLGSHSRLKQEYCTQNNIYTSHTYLELILKNFSGKSIPLPSNLSQALRQGTQELCSTIHDAYNVDLEPEIIFGCWSERLAQLHGIFHYITGLKGYAPLWFISESAKPLHKVIASAIRHTGSDVVGLLHGYYFGEHLPKNFIYNDVAPYSAFLVPNSSCASYLEQEYINADLPKSYSTQFFATETTYYEELLQQNQKVNLPKSINTIMLLGFPMNAIRYYYVPGLFFPYQLDIEIRLIKYLNEKGIRVIYKMHPDRIQVAMDIFSKLDVEIVVDPFEKCWMQADALLIKYTASTILPFALCTNRPIFMLTHEKDIFSAEHFELLAKRCRMIPAWMDERNTIQFDQDAFSAALQVKPEMPNYEYIERFMYPANRNTPLNQ